MVRRHSPYKFSKLISMNLNDDEEFTCDCGEEDCEECGGKVKENEDNGDDDYGDGREL